MNITEAKQIPLQTLVEHLGGRYSHTDRKGDHWYHSPFRPDEQTASFKINEKLNTWHDFGLSQTFAHQNQGSGGDILDLWCDYHFKNRRDGIKEALQALEDLSKVARRGDNHVGQTKRTERPAAKSAQPTFKIVKIARRISHRGLLQELQRRKVSVELAELYLKQGQILNTVNGKTYYGFLFENSKGGYELSIPNPEKGTSFKTCIGAKAITYFPPAKEKNSADVFEGFFDFLSWLEIKKLKHPMHHTFVLNSNSLAGDACEQIITMNDRLNYIFLFLDNDTSGYETTHAMALALEPYDFQVASMDGFYKGFKDLSEYQKLFK
jgi:hypothetical protein